MKYLMCIPDVYTFMTKYLNDSRHVLFNTSMVTDDVSLALVFAKSCINVDLIVELNHNVIICSEARSTHFHVCTS